MPTAAAAPDAVHDPAAHAEAAGLCYLPDTAVPGITRERIGGPESKDFRYRNPDGSEVRDTETRIRIKSLVVPPAWERVWISPDPNGHLQATGYDVRGRKQYRYHPEWSTYRGETKFSRMRDFGRALPGVRKRVEQALNQRSRMLTRERVLAALVGLLDHTLVRVGNPEYARSNKSFGLTTLRVRHLKVKGRNVQFEFKGKKGIQHTVRITDRRLARIAQHCRDLPGQHLFQYVAEDGSRHEVSSQDVNAYIQILTGGSFSAKDFRTWGGSAVALGLFLQTEVPPSPTGQKRAVNEVLRQVAARLGNTLAVCRKYYVHPKLAEYWAEGRLQAIAARHRRKGSRLLEQDERLLLAVLDDLEKPKRPSHKRNSTAAQTQTKASV